MSIFTKGINKGAYRGRLTCPVCESEANRLLEWVTNTRARYRCRKCGLTYQYDIGGRRTHPYGPFKSQQFRRIVKAHRERNFRELVDLHWEKIRGRA